MELGSNVTTRQSAAEASQLCVTSARAKHAFLPPDNITFRVKTDHLGTQSPRGREAQWLSQPGNHPQPVPWTSGKCCCHSSAAPRPLSDPAERMGSCTHGHNKGGRQLLPSWLYLLSFLHPDLFGISMGLNSCRSQTFPGFPLTLPFWQKRGVWLGRSVNTPFLLSTRGVTCQ